MKKLGIVLLAMVMLALSAGCAAPKDDPVPPEDANIEDIAVNFVTDLSTGDFAAAAEDYAYAGKMRQVINEKFLKDEVWDYLTANYGAFEGFASPVTAQTGEYETVTVTASFEQGDVNMNITFEDNKLIAGIHSVPVQ